MADQGHGDRVLQAAGGRSLPPPGVHPAGRLVGNIRAWCSIPHSKNAKPKEAWQYETDFRLLHSVFPELVDEQGNGWFARHVHGVRDFLKHHPEKVGKPALKNLEPLSHGWDREWRDKVIRFQILLFSPETKGGWVLRFDDILADALELGPLRSPTISLPPGLEQRLADAFPSAKPEVLLTLLQYYVANKQEDSPWVCEYFINFIPPFCAVCSFPAA